MMTLQKQKRRFSIFFNKRKHTQKQRNYMSLNSSSRLDQSSSKENLRRNENDDTGPHEFRNFVRSSNSMKHLQTDGSSFDQLNQICRELYKESNCDGASISSTKIELRGNECSGVQCVPESKRTLNSDGSSGRELQSILEKLILQENKQKKLEILPQDCMFQKKLCNNYEMRTPPLQESRVSYNSSPCAKKLRSQQNEPATPSSQTKFRFEMVIDPNEQAKLFIKSRRNKKKKRRKRTGQPTNQHQRSLLLDTMSELEVKSQSDVSVSSCSIDSVLEDRVRAKTSLVRSHPSSSQNKGYNRFENYSCRASQLADDVRAAFVNSYGLASNWVGSCFPISNQDSTNEHLD